MDPNTSWSLDEQHRLLYQCRHFYQEDDNVPVCPQRCIVFGTVCICELLFDHDGPCERIQTWKMATMEDYKYLKQYKNFVDSETVPRGNSAAVLRFIKEHDGLDLSLKEAKQIVLSQ